MPSLKRFTEDSLRRCPQHDAMVNLNEWLTRIEQLEARVQALESKPATPLTPKKDK